MIEVLKYLSGFSVLGIFLYFVMKLLINKLIEAGLEKYKANLLVDLETHKANLTKITQEHKIKFEHLHKERAETIKHLHDKICICEDVLSHLTTLAQGAEWTIDHEREEKARSELFDFYQSIRASKLYLEQDICTKMEKLYRFSLNIVFQMRKAKNKEDSNKQLFKLYRYVPIEQIQSPIDDWQEASRKVTEDFKSNREQIESEFRELLGGKE